VKGACATPKDKDKDKSPMWVINGVMKGRPVKTTSELQKNSYVTGLIYRRSKDSLVIIIIIIIIKERFNVAFSK